MPVAPYSPGLFETCKQIHAFLSAGQQQASEQQQTKLANISLSLDALAKPLPESIAPSSYNPLPPWRILEALGQPRQIHFCYSAADCKMVALGQVVMGQATGLSRFARIQQFIEVWRNRTTCYAPHLTGGRPHFFCGFTFFDEAENFDPAQAFVPRLQVTCQTDQTTVSFNCLIDDAVNVTAIVEDLNRQLQKLLALATSTAAATPPHRPSQKVDRDLGDFKRSVGDALKIIQQQPLRKVVLADAIEVLASVPFQVAASLRSLAQQYPNCHVFSFSNGSGQTFLGASPERLLSIRDGELLTDALAGSAPRGGTTEQDTQLAEQLQTSQKERYEHQIVVDFIAQQLRSLGLTPSYSRCPTVRQLANIQHLHTPIQAHLKQAIEPLTILERLHPTPAVAGLPRAAACDLIRQSESFDRELYAAPLGWIDTAGNSNFIVGIRSALLNGRQARLYAGAGIVAQSNPEKELAEVRLKLQAMLSSLM
ncbi:MAG: isochorismate synthase [Cyanobacteria bacterium J06554_6]